MQTAAGQSVAAWTYAAANRAGHLAVADYANTRKSQADLRRRNGPRIPTPLPVAVQMEAGLTANGWPGWSTALPPPGFCDADLFEQRSATGSEIEVRRCLRDHFCHRSGRVGRVDQQNVPSAAQGEQRFPHPFHGCDRVPAVPASERLPGTDGLSPSASTAAA
jgi:hypothetical protein